MCTHALNNRLHVVKILNFRISLELNDYRIFQDKQKGASTKLITMFKEDAKLFTNELRFTSMKNRIFFEKRTKVDL